MKIHPTAIVSSKAEIEEEVEIGPFSCVEDEVKIGSGTRVSSHCVIEKWTEIGKNNYIGKGSILGGLPQDLKFKEEKSKVVVGNNNVIREYVTINRACGESEKTTLGDDNYIMTQVHFGHNCQVGNNVTIINNTGLAGYVEVEDGAVISGLVGVHQFVRVGKLSMIGGLSAVRQDVPPYSLVVGNPAYLRGINAVGLKRAGLSPDTREKIRSAFRVLFMSDLNLQQAKEKLNLPEVEEVQHLISFLETSKRGYLRWEKEN